MGAKSARGYSERTAGTERSTAVKEEEKREEEEKGRDHRSGETGTAEVLKFFILLEKK